jgi:hypothetical protein
MNPSDIAPMVIGLTLIVVTGGVLVLRPLAKRLGDYLEVLVSSRKAERSLPSDSRLVEVVERLEERVRFLEQRQDFTDSMLGSGTGRRSLQEADHAEDRQDG